MQFLVVIWTHILQTEHGILNRAQVRGPAFLSQILSIIALLWESQISISLHFLIYKMKMRKSVRMISMISRIIPWFIHLWQISCDNRHYLCFFLNHLISVAMLLFIIVYKLIFLNHLSFKDQQLFHYSLKKLIISNSYSKRVETKHPAEMLYMQQFPKG